MFGQEVHAVALDEAVAQAGVACGRAQRHRDPALDVIGHHAIEQQVILAFGDGFDPVVLAPHHSRHVRQVLAHEVPRGFLGAGVGEEALLKGGRGLVGRDDEILFDELLNGLFVGFLLLIQCPHIGHDKPYPEHGFLDRIPDTILRVVEFDGHPPPRFEHSVDLCECFDHQSLIVSQGSFARLIHHSFRLAPGENLQPGFPEEVQLRVVQVVAERRINEDIVN